MHGYQLSGRSPFSVADPDGSAVISTANVLRFVRDDANREELAGTVARIRIWDRPLTATQVLAPCALRPQSLRC